MMWLVAFRFGILCVGSGDHWMMTWVGKSERGGGEMMLLIASRF